VSPRVGGNNFWPLVMLVVLLAGGVLVYRGVHQLLRVQEKLRQVVETNHRLAEKNQMLYNRVRRLRGDDRALERVVRREMGMVRPDEVIYQLAGRGGKDQGREP